MRRKIAAGNWKMNNTKAESEALAKAISSVDIPEDTEVILGVPFVYLSQVKEIIAGSKVQIAAQNCHQEESGAYTGEISAPMLASFDIDYVILGHSERREYFGEDNALLAAKVDAARNAGLKVIFCCGEPLNIREEETHVSYVKKQLQEGLFHLAEDALDDIVIAYEPIWAIGTGVTASKEQAQDMHKEIRDMIGANYSDEAAANMHILYGGSVKPGNATELFGQEDVDGGLVGGASLKADDFTAIIKA